MSDDFEQDNSVYTSDCGQFWGNSGAGGIFFCKMTGRVCLPLRSQYVNEPGTWGTWGGKIDDGESPHEAMQREVFEETNYHGTLEIIPVHLFEKGEFRYHNFILIIEREFMPQLNWETEHSEWFHVEDLPSPLHFGLMDFKDKLIKKIQELSIEHKVKKK